MTALVVLYFLGFVVLVWFVVLSTRSPLEVRAHASERQWRHCHNCKRSERAAIGLRPRAPVLGTGKPVGRRAV